MLHGLGKIFREYMPLKGSSGSDNPPPLLLPVTFHPSTLYPSKHMLSEMFLGSISRVTILDRLAVHMMSISHYSLEMFISIV